MSSGRTTSISSPNTHRTSLHHHRSSLGTVSPKPSRSASGGPTTTTRRLSGSKRETPTRTTTTTSRTNSGTSRTPVRRKKTSTSASSRNNSTGASTSFASPPPPSVIRILGDEVHTPQSSASDMTVSEREAISCTARHPIVAQLATLQYFINTLTAASKSTDPVTQIHLEFGRVQAEVATLLNEKRRLGVQLRDKDDTLAQVRDDLKDQLTTTQQVAQHMHTVGGLLNTARRELEDDCHSSQQELTKTVSSCNTSVDSSLSNASTSTIQNLCTTVLNAAQSTLTHMSRMQDEVTSSTQCIVSMPQAIARVLALISKTVTDRDRESPTRSRSVSPMAPTRAASPPRVVHLSAQRNLLTSSPVMTGSTASSPNVSQSSPARTRHSDPPAVSPYTSPTLRLPPPEDDKQRPISPLFSDLSTVGTASPTDSQSKASTLFSLVSLTATSSKHSPTASMQLLQQEARVLHERMSGLQEEKNLLKSQVKRIQELFGAEIVRVQDQMNALSYRASLCEHCNSSTPPPPGRVSPRGGVAPSPSSDGTMGHPSSSAESILLHQQLLEKDDELENLKAQVTKLQRRAESPLPPGEPFLGLSDAFEEDAQGMALLQDEKFILQRQVDHFRVLASKHGAEVSRLREHILLLRETNQTLSQQVKTVSETNAQLNSARSTIHALKEQKEHLQERLDSSQQLSASHHHHSHLQEIVRLKGEIKVLQEENAALRNYQTDSIQQMTFGNWGQQNSPDLMKVKDMVKQQLTKYLSVLAGMRCLLSSVRQLVYGLAEGLRTDSSKVMSSFDILLQLVCLSSENSFAQPQPQSQPPAALIPQSLKTCAHELQQLKVAHGALRLFTHGLIDTTAKEFRFIVHNAVGQLLTSGQSGWLEAAGGGALPAIGGHSANVLLCKFMAKLGNLTRQMADSQKNNEDCLNKLRTDPYSHKLNKLQESDVNVTTLTTLQQKIRQKDDDMLVLHMEHTTTLSDYILKLNEMCFEIAAERAQLNSAHTHNIPYPYDDSPTPSHDRDSANQKIKLLEEQVQGLKAENSSLVASAAQDPTAQGTVWLNTIKRMSVEKQGLESENARMKQEVSELRRSMVQLQPPASPP
eukprot:TRINITY_DN65655_c0_g2_i1.p1 TRINITY_DN65655_c0_g2~~TRINITY_DN65655_c0_g2_i1.p1  ORF type:complete len:1094 (+),score=55.16 TRINITY_DN65655_c0_g2_i1:80-3361(+)